MRRFLSSIPIWIVLADMVYGFTLNVTQSLNSRHSAPTSSDGLPLTPDIAFNSLQTLSIGIKNMLGGEFYYNLTVPY